MGSNVGKLRRQLAMWTVISIAVFVFGLWALSAMSSNGGDAAMWTLGVLITVAGLAGALGTLALRSKLPER